MSELPQSSPSPSPIQRSWQRCLHQGLLRQQSAELDLLPQGGAVGPPGAAQDAYHLLPALRVAAVCPVAGGQALSPAAM